MLIPEVIFLSGAYEELPALGVNGQKIYLKSENLIYEFRDEWISLGVPQEGFYLFNDVLFTYISSISKMVVSTTGNSLGVFTAEPWFPTLRASLKDKFYVCLNEAVVDEYKFRPGEVYQLLVDGPTSPVHLKKITLSLEKNVYQIQGQTLDTHLTNLNKIADLRVNGVSYTQGEDYTIQGSVIRFVEDQDGEVVLEIIDSNMVSILTNWFDITEETTELNVGYLSEPYKIYRNGIEQTSNFTYSDGVITFQEPLTVGETIKVKRYF